MLQATSNLINLIFNKGMFYSHLITTLSFARARSRSEVRTSSHFSHLITTLTDFWPIFTMAMEPGCRFVLIVAAPL